MVTFVQNCYSTNTNKNSSCAVVGPGNNWSKHTIMLIRHCCFFALGWRRNKYTEEFPQDLLCAFNINTPGACSLPGCLLQCQQCTEGYLSKEIQNIPFCAFQLWVRSHGGILSYGEPEAQVFVLSQTLYSNGDGKPGKSTRGTFIKCCHHTTAKAKNTSLKLCSK